MKVVQYCFSMTSSTATVTAAVIIERIQLMTVNVTSHQQLLYNVLFVFNECF